MRVAATSRTRATGGKMTEPTLGRNEPGADPQRTRNPRVRDSTTEVSWGAIVVIAGLIALVTVFSIAVATYDKAADVTTAVGAVSGVIAAMVGAYFGIRGAVLGQA